MENGFDYMVAVTCTTYNHVNYIYDALCGFMMQESSFPIVFVVVDDASTDGTSDFLYQWAIDNLDKGNKRNLWKEMPQYQLAIASQKGRPLSRFVFLLLKENHYQSGRYGLVRQYISNWNQKAKYAAFCEGDDYWIDPYKLQRQVDFMEKHEDFGICHTDYIEFRQDVMKSSFIKRNCINGKVTENLIKGDFYIATPTVLYRTKIRNEIDQEYLKCGFLMGDLPLWIEMSRISKVYYLPVVTSCYRILANSASHSSSRLRKARFQLNLYEIRKYFIDKYDYRELSVDNERNLYYNKAIVCALQRDLILAFRFFLKSRRFSIDKGLHFVTRFLVKP